MKPYFRAIFNIVHLLLIKARCKNFTFHKYTLFSYNSKILLNRYSSVEFGEGIISDGRTVIISDIGSNLKIGNHVYFNEDSMISCKGNICIGDGCKFGPNVKIFDNNHKFDAVNGVSDEHNIGSIEIGKNCWIGSNVVLLKGTKIGNNCVIGAGCIISSEIPNTSIVTQGRDICIKPITNDLPI